MQAAFQEYTDNGVSKTVNLPHDATVRDVRDAYLLAHRLKCKGITVYRYGTRVEQTLYTGQYVPHRPEQVHTHDVEEHASSNGTFVEVGPEYTGDCKQCSP